MSLIITPITIKEACVYVDAHHRHHRAPQGALFAVAVSTVDAEGNATNGGVALVGRPVSRHEQADSWTAEVIRVATDGTKYACSALYGACWRAARAIGYQRLITYTLQAESGTSLRGAGWTQIAECKGGSWSRKDRPRIDTHPTQGKFKWEKNRGPR